MVKEHNKQLKKTDAIFKNLSSRNHPPTRHVNYVCSSYLCRNIELLFKFFKKNTLPKSLQNIVLRPHSIYHPYRTHYIFLYFGLFVRLFFCFRHWNHVNKKDKKEQIVNHNM